MTPRGALSPTRPAPECVAGGASRRALHPPGSARRPPPARGGLRPGREPPSGPSPPHHARLAQAAQPGRHSGGDVRRRRRWEKAPTTVQCQDADTREMLILAYAAAVGRGTMARHAPATSAVAAWRATSSAQRRRAVGEGVDDRRQDAAWRARPRRRRRGGSEGEHIIVGHEPEGVEVRRADQHLEGQHARALIGRRDDRRSPGSRSGSRERLGPGRVDPSVPSKSTFSGLMSRWCRSRAWRSRRNRSRRPARCAARAPHVWARPRAPASGRLLVPRRTPPTRRRRGPTRVRAAHRRARRRSSPATFRSDSSDLMWYLSMRFTQGPFLVDGRVDRGERAAPRWCRRTCVEIKIYGAFLNRALSVLHVIGATPARAAMWGPHRSTEPGRPRRRREIETKPLPMWPFARSASAIGGPGMASSRPSRASTS